MSLQAACSLARTVLQKCWQNACLCMHFINNWCESTKLTQQTEVFKKMQPSPGTLVAHELHQRNIGRMKADWIETTMLQRISPGFCVHGKTHGDEKLLPPLVQLTFNRGSACSKNQPATAWPASWYATVFFSSGCSTCVFFSRPARDEKEQQSLKVPMNWQTRLALPFPKPWDLSGLLATTHFCAYLWARGRETTRTFKHATVCEKRAPKSASCISYFGALSVTPIMTQWGLLTEKKVFDDIFTDNDGSFDPNAEHLRSYCCKWSMMDKQAHKIWRMSCMSVYKLWQVQTSKQ